MLGIALPLQREHHLLYRRAPAADAAEALPQSQRHAPQRVLHKRLALGEAEQQEESLSGWLQPSTGSLDCGPGTGVQVNSPSQDEDRSPLFTPEGH